MYFKLYKWYQIAQNITYAGSHSSLSVSKLFDNENLGSDGNEAEQSFFGQ